MVKGNWGCCSIQPIGWHNIDVQDFGQEYIGSTELFEDNYFGIIVAHCSLQINEWHDIPKVLSELHRVLKPKGVIRISLPDIETGFEEFKKGNINWFPNGEEDLNIRFSSWLTWYSTTKTLLTKKAAMQKLADAGFVMTAICQFGQTFFSTDEITELDTRQFEAFFIEGLKGNP